MIQLKQTKSTTPAKSKKLGIATWTARLAGACAAGAIGAPAFAQQSGNAPSANESADVITVTARIREEAVQDVPIQIKVFSAAEIIDAGIATTQDFFDLTPNISLDDSFTHLNTFAVVRGVTQINNADSPLAVIVDGAPQNNQRQLKMNLFDIEQIEVLKGPQGAFYGRNASGGAVRIVTRQPTNEFEGFVSGVYGNGDALEFSGTASGPLVEDRLLFRVAGSYKQDDGRIENAFLGQNVDAIDHDYNIRGKLLFIASDQVTLDARVSYNDFKAGALYDSFVPSGDANDFQDPSNNLLGDSIGDVFEATFKADADLGFATLTAITAYTELNETVRGDIDFSNPINNPSGAFGAGSLGQGSDLSLGLISQELRLVSPDDQRLRWLAGAFYIHTDRELEAVLFADLNGDIEQINNPALIFLRQFEDDDNDAWSIYGQLEYDISDRLKIAAGMRYDEDKRFQEDLLTGATREISFSAVQPKITLSYDVADNALFYTSYGEGFRSGGFNAPGVAPFRDEITRSVEGGFKSQWLDKRLTLNGAVYYSFVEDFQFFFLSLAQGGQIISNIDRVEIFGVELEAQANLTDEWRVYAGLGTTDTEIKENTPFPTSVGNHTPKTTDLSLNLGSQYRFPVVDDVFAFLRVDYERRGERFWQVDNLDVQNPLDLVSFRAGFETDRWGLYAWGKNITDEDYFTDYNPTEFSGLGFDIGFRGQPASYGVEGRVRF
jgi:iron complex outermembrane recepter protein